MFDYFPLYEVKTKIVSRDALDVVLLSDISNWCFWDFIDVTLVSDDTYGNFLCDAIESGHILIHMFHLTHLINLICLIKMIR